MTGRAVALLEEGSSRMGIVLSPAMVEQFRVLLGELRKWSGKINLTSIRDDREIVVKHFLDSLTLLKVIEGDGEFLDIGSGAGFPVIPLLLARPGLAATSIDAVQKKILFQRHVARLLGLAGLHTIHGRAEELSLSHPARFAWIVSRALSDIPTFASLAQPLLAPNGTIVAMKGRGGEEEAAAARGHLSSIGLAVERIERFTLPLSNDQRSLVIIRPLEGRNDADGVTAKA